MNPLRDEVMVAICDNTDLDKEQVKELLEVPPDVDMGDFALPCFQLGDNPIKVAEHIKEKIDSDIFKSVEVKGPYLNMHVNSQIIFDSITQQVTKKPGDIVVEFVSPNVNKPLHIGHARNMMIGRSISNLLRKQGSTVTKEVLYNDRGVHICKSMLAYQKVGGDEPSETGEKPDHFVGRYYQRFAELSKDNPGLEDEAQSMLQAWESGEKETLELWKKLHNWCIKGMRETFERFNISHDVERFESEIYTEGKDIIQSHVGTVFYRDEDGAVVADLGDKLGIKHVLRADGTTIYMTQDIALAMKRFDENHDEIIYVVGKEQSYHFQCLFAILERLGISADSLHHLGYGHVTLKSGKMSSRVGTVVLVDDLTDSLVETARAELEKRGRFTPEKAETIGQAALIFYLLKHDTWQDMTFDPSESVSFQGETGPYLLYTYARIESVLEGADSTEMNAPLDTREERQLLRKLTRFSDIVEEAASQRSPSKLAVLMIDIAQAFNEFYHAHRIRTDVEEVQKSRLALTKRTQDILRDGFDLLGIPYLEEM